MLLACRGERGIGARSSATARSSAGFLLFHFTSKVTTKEEGDSGGEWDEVFNYVQHARRAHEIPQ